MADKGNTILVVSGAGTRLLLEEDLRVYFSSYGQVLAVQLFRAEGYGYVTLPPDAPKDVILGRAHTISSQPVEVTEYYGAKPDATAAAAAQAAAMLQHYSNPLAQQQIYAAQAAAVAQQQAAAAGGGDKKLHLRNLPPDMTQEDIMQYFQHFGKIAFVTVCTDLSGNPRGFGFVKFDAEEVAQQVLLSGTEHNIRGARISVQQSSSATKKRENPGDPAADQKRQRWNTAAAWGYADPAAAAAAAAVPDYSAYGASQSMAAAAALHQQGWMGAHGSL